MQLHTIQQNFSRTSKKRVKNNFYSRPPSPERAGNLSSFQLISLRSCFRCGDFLQSSFYFGLNLILQLTSFDRSYWTDDEACYCSNSIGVWSAFFMKTKLVNEIIYEPFAIIIRTRSLQVTTNPPHNRNPTKHRVQLHKFLVLNKLQY